MAVKAIKISAFKTDKAINISAFKTDKVIKKLVEKFFLSTITPLDILC